MTIQSSIDFILDKIFFFSKKSYKKRLKTRRLVLVTDEGVKSLNISPKAQLIAVISVLIILWWLSFSTFKYLSVADSYSYKNEIIENLSKSNDKLKKRVELLNSNLSQVDKYFKKINIIKNKKSSKINLNKDIIENSKSNSEEVLLFKIQNEMTERIKYLEKAFEYSGLSLNGNDFKSKNLAKGGIFIPDPGEIRFDKDLFEGSIHHLVVLESLIDAMPTLSPAKNYRVSSTFGYRKDPINSRRAIHNGLDLVAKKNSNILGTADGVITFAGRNGGYGLMVEIQHANKFKTRYAHLKSISVKLGQKVTKNQPVGIQGSTGRSTGDHLHYEVLLNDNHMNPDDFINLGKYLF